MFMGRHLLTQSAYLAKPTSHVHDTRLGQPISIVQFDDVIDPVPCLLQSLMPIERIDIQAMGVVKEAFLVFFAADAVVGEAWRVRRVEDPDGLVLAQDLEVTGVRRVANGLGRVDHLEATAYIYREGANLPWQAAE